MKLFLILLAVIAAFVIHGVFFTPADPAWTATRTAQRYVQTALKAPSTAKFPESGGAKQIAPGRWQVWGSVDSQNSFGAMVRSDWIATVKNSKDDWEAIYARIGDQEIGTNPEVERLAAAAAAGARKNEARAAAAKERKVTSR